MKKIIIGIMVIVGLIGLVSGSKTDYSIYEQKTINIEVGDTMWSIAEDYTDNQVDLREYIYELKKLNNMTSSELEVGQKLIIIDMR